MSWNPSTAPSPHSTAHTGVWVGHTRPSFCPQNMEVPSRSCLTAVLWGSQGAVLRVQAHELVGVHWSQAAGAWMCPGIVPSVSPGYSLCLHQGAGVFLAPPAQWAHVVVLMEELHLNCLLVPCACPPCHTLGLAPFSEGEPPVNCCSPGWKGCNLAGSGKLPCSVTWGLARSRLCSHSCLAVINEGCLGAYQYLTKQLPTFRL